MIIKKASFGKLFFRVGGTATRARQQADAPRARKSRASRRHAPESPLTGTGLNGQPCGV